MSSTSTGVGACNRSVAPSRSRTSLTSGLSSGAEATVTWLAEVITEAWWTMRASRTATPEASGGVGQHERLCDADGLLATFALEGQLGGHHHPSRHIVDRAEPEVHADPIAHRQRRREAQLVETVVEHEAHAVHAQQLLEEAGSQREGVVTVGDCPAERRLSGALGIDVDPLAVAGQLGERVDVGLSDIVPAAHTQVLASVGLQLVDAVDRQRVLMEDAHETDPFVVAAATGISFPTSVLADWTMCPAP